MKRVHEKGDWKIEYEKGKNKEITFDVVPWHKPITANSISFKTSFSIGYDLPFIQGKLNAEYEGRYYNYIISAAIKDADGNITNMIEIGNGSGSSGNDDEFSNLMFFQMANIILSPKCMQRTKREPRFMIL